MACAYSLLSFLDFQVLEVTRMAYALPRSIQFFHRENWDSSVDSICGLCYLTVGLAENEADLREEEQGHCCTGEQSNVLPFVDKRRL
jgi:hypothetical protein